MTSTWNPSFKSSSVLLCQRHCGTVACCSFTVTLPTERNRGQKCWILPWWLHSSRRTWKIEKSELSSWNRFAFSIFDLSNPNLKKKSMRAKEARGAGKWALWKFLQRARHRLLILTQGASCLWCFRESQAGSQEPCWARLLLNVKNKTHSF
jgi:hypothetical protein